MARIDHSGYLLSLHLCFLLLILGLIALRPLPGFMISSNFYIPKSPTPSHSDAWDYDEKKRNPSRHILLGASTNLMRKVLPYCLMVHDAPYSENSLV
jgi:hypothetical protein